MIRLAKSGKGRKEATETDPYYAERRYCLVALLRRAQGFFAMVRKLTLHIWLVVVFVMMFGGMLMIMTQPVGELATPFAKLGLVVTFCSAFLLVIPIVTLGKARSRFEAGRMGYFGIPVDEYQRRCARCSQMFTPRRSYHRLCDRCYYGRK